MIFQWNRRKDITIGCRQILKIWRRLDKRLLNCIMTCICLNNADGSVPKSSPAEALLSMPLLVFACCSHLIAVHLVRICKPPTGTFGTIDINSAERYLELTITDITDSTGPVLQGYAALEPKNSTRSHHWCTTCPYHTIARHYIYRSTLLYALNLQLMLYMCCCAECHIEFQINFFKKYLMRKKNGIWSNNHYDMQDGIPSYKWERRAHFHPVALTSRRSFWRIISA